jgi:NADH-quinone oxidoreductase subunit A
MEDYFNIFFYSGIALCIASLILVLSNLVISVFQPSAEKTTAYECGFDAYEDARNAFEVRFYLFGIFFIVFDLELAYLIPWSLSVNTLNLTGVWCMFEFFVELCLGLFYIWKIGKLDWN